MLQLHLSDQQFNCPLKCACIKCSTVVLQFIYIYTCIYWHEFDDVLQRIWCYWTVVEFSSSGDLVAQKQKLQFTRSWDSLQPGIIQSCYSPGLGAMGIDTNLFLEIFSQLTARPKKCIRFCCYIQHSHSHQLFVDVHHPIVLKYRYWTQNCFMKIQFDGLVQDCSI